MTDPPLEQTAESIGLGTKRIMWMIGRRRRGWTGNGNYKCGTIIIIYHSISSCYQELEGGGEGLTAGWIFDA